MLSPASSLPSSSSVGRNAMRERIRRRIGVGVRLRLKAKLESVPDPTTNVVWWAKTDRHGASCTPAPSTTAVAWCQRCLPLVSRIVACS